MQGEDDKCEKNVTPAVDICKCQDKGAFPETSERQTETNGRISVLHRSRKLTKYVAGRQTVVLKLYQLPELTVTC
jgi:hypothetical protein